MAAVIYKASKGEEAKEDKAISVVNRRRNDYWQGRTTKVILATSMRVNPTQTSQGKLLKITVIIKDMSHLGVYLCHQKRYIFKLSGNVDKELELCQGKSCKTGLIFATAC